jgi:hypothetical protein
MTPDSFILDDHRLADARAAEQTHLPALGVGREQVDHLDAGLEHLGGRREVLHRRRGAVDRPALLDLDLLALVDRLAQDVEDPAQRHRADGHRDRAAGVDHLHPARQTVGHVHGDRADAVVAEVLLDLADHHTAVVRALDRDRIVDLGQRVGERGLDDDALDLLDPPGARGRLLGRALSGAGFHSMAPFAPRSSYATISGRH